MKPSAYACLGLLRKAGEDGCRVRDFLEIGCARYGARIKELRENGYEVETEHLSGSAYLYRLVYDPDAETGNEAAAPPPVVDLGAGQASVPDEVLPASLPTEGEREGRESAATLFDLEQVPRKRVYEDAA